ncbi:acyl carrier protein [Thelephora ganbajun]|uniref:Acyl carrier protein n=1 Tax=Thelephora ganbajun TaxID=370292 RepID=A0ACB6ZZ57_THEGA|nr:acyl carrier protein [Thelephora ganbajun]
MSFFRVAFRGPVASLARNRVSVSAAAIPRRTWLPQRATFSVAAGLTKEEITTRVLDVLKGFEKVDPAKLTTEASFTGDLGLDSLDTVEVVMAVEEEFTIEIPDAEADEIKTVQQAVNYIAKTPEAH